MLFISGLKFKLVKSNSCSSRLELTGTGSEKGNFDATEQMRNIIHHERDSSLSDDSSEHDKALSEHEETVKDMVNRLESKAVVAPSKPRIIESRCIEKVVKDFSPKVTINQQSFEQAKADPNENVTVNSHISVPSSGSSNPHDDADASNVAKPKVVRNKNVDLALASVTKRNEHLKSPKAPSGDTENLAHTESFKEHSPEHSHIRQSKWSNISKMDSVEMVKNQDKINNCAHIKGRPNNIVDVGAPQKLPPQSGLVDIKMVNWSTVGSALGKEYIANDRSLIQTKVYDEMEFEEFEVMGEHYDSLNSK